MRDYINTNKESGGTLAMSRKKARAQQEVIMDFYRERPFRRFAPHEIQELVLPNAPLTSVRRAMTNLADAGLLTKSKRADAVGSYGKQVHFWSYRPYNREQKQQELW